MISLASRSFPLAMTMIALTIVSKVFADDTAADKATDACTAAVILTTLADELETKITAHDSNLEKIQQALAKAAAASYSAPQTDITKLAGPIYLTLASEAETLTQAIQNQKKILTRALKLTANLSGQEAVVAAVAEIEIADHHYGHANPTSAGTGATAIRLNTLKQKPNADCMAKLNNKVADFKNLLSETALQKIKVFALQAVPKPTDADTAPLVGVAAGGTCTKGTTSKAIAGSTTYACTIGGKLLQADPQTLDAGSDGKFKQAPTSTADSGDIANNNKIAATEILAAAKAVAKGAANFDPQALDSYSSSDTFRKAVGLIYGGILPDKPAPTDTERINQLIKEHYGEPSNFKNKFWGEVDKIKLPATLLGTKAGGTLANVDTLETAAKLTLQAQLLTEANKGENAPGVAPQEAGQGDPGDKTGEKKDWDKKATAADCKATE
uniref:Variant surface glycoprotein 1125.4825 n=1 Tax=Trypanosoma brucei TaxID=5691 RepID=A0A1J0RBC8_9TRYP|nr:variant surface glycoprotein 1125.4825 [Trypanosoma brucei]